MATRDPETSRQRRRAQERRRRKAAGRRGSRSGAALTLGALAAGAPAVAATFTVTNLGDALPVPPAGSLREAVQLANANPDSDVIVFQAGLSGTLTLAGSQLYLYEAVEIQGPGPAVVTIDAGGLSRAFYVFDGALATTIDVTISGLTLTGGDAPVGGAVANAGENLVLDDVVVTGNNADFVGGGVVSFYTSSALTVRDSVISGNTAGGLGGGLGLYYSGTAEIENTVIENNDAGIAGGGIGILASEGSIEIRTSTVSGNDAGIAGGGIAGAYVYGATTVRDTTIAGNTAGVGGGVAVGGLFGSLTIASSTISGNTANDEGGGGGVNAAGLYGQLTIENSTISGNQATACSGGGVNLYSFYFGPQPQIRHSTIAGNSAADCGGGIYLYGSLLLDHTIVGDNTDSGGANDLANGPEGSQFDLAFSLVETPGAANVNDLGGNVLNQDPLLGPLQDNGGLTFTQRPGAGSPALDAGDPGFVPPPSVDQRGFGRVANGQIDIGAVEINPGTVQFTASAAVVGEGAGAVILTASRTGGVDGPATVDFDTADGTAVAPGDYLVASGTLNWADLDGATKSFPVTIVEDLDVEPSETFSAVLSNAQGAALGSPATQVVTILDNDVPSIMEIPTLGDVGRLLLVGLLGAAGVLAARRRGLGGGGGLTAPVVVLTLALASAEASAPPADPAAAVAARQLVREIRVGELETRGDTAHLRLADGTTLTVPLAELRVRQRGELPWPRGRRGLRQVTAPAQSDGARPVLVRVLRGPDGAIRRVRVVLFDTPEAASRAAARRTED